MASDAMRELLLHNEVQVSIQASGQYFVAVRPYGCAPLWYHAIADKLDDALAKAASNKLAKRGARRVPAFEARP